MPPEAAPAAAAPITPAAPAAAPPAAPTSAGALSAVPTPPEWATGFKEETRSYVSQKGFKTPEALAESYKHLEAKLSTKHPEDRTILLPEKMEGAEARAVWERLGAPKEAKDYALPRDEKSTDPKFTEWAETAFYKHNLTKDQALGVVKDYNERLIADAASRAETQRNSILQANETLKKEWGASYDANLNLAKQGAKILGLDAKTLDTIEATQGREKLFKSLQRIGVSVGEAGFVDGGAGGPTAMTPEQAQGEISKLIKDKEFGKKVNSGDVEATKRWNELNKLAAPGEKPIG